MITIDDARAHLEAAGHAYPDAGIAAALAAEHAHQRSVTHVTGTRPVALDEALLRRVEVNLETTDGRGDARVGGRDEQVRALEADHLRRRPGSAEQQHIVSRGQQRRRTRAARKGTASTKQETPKENS